MRRGIVDLPDPGSGGIMGFNEKGSNEQGGQHEATLFRVRVTELNRIQSWQGSGNCRI